MAIGMEYNTNEDSELTIFDQRDWTNWNELTQGAQRDLETMFLLIF